MADKILEFVHTSTGKQIAAALGLPVPPQLKRAKAGYAERHWPIPTPWWAPAHLAK